MMAVPAKSDQWVEAVAKLTKLTQDGELVWNAESLSDAEGVIGPTYKAWYGDKILRLQMRGVMAKKRSWEGEGWQELPMLEFVDSNDKTLWTFPTLDAIQHLYGAVQYQTAGVRDFLDDLLKQ
jgi:hypothetical protein